MKIFLLFVVISLIISAGLTFFVLAEKEVIDPVRQQYDQVFSEFEKTAEEMYSLYAVYGLEILLHHRIEGLRVLKQYGHLIEPLQPYMDSETLFSICQEHGAQLEKLLAQFQPALIAEIYSQFGMDGLRYVLDNPEVYFLLLKYGERLVQLANAKGPIVFDLVKKHQPEFIELYYDDALFKAIARFGVDGLIAIKTYRGMATTILDLFADDARLSFVLRKYGYQQVIPLLYYFYQTKSRSTIIEQLANFDVHKLFQQKTDNSTRPPMPETNAQIPLERKQFDRARWALTRLYEQGNTFLRQFDISENGDVTPLQIVSLTNVLEDLLIAGLRDQSVKIPPSSLQKGERGSDEQGRATCEQLATALDILGLLPHETLFSKQARCIYLRTALSTVTAREGIEGLIALDEHEEFVTRYGKDVIPFVAEYGQEGIQLLQQTDGKILQLTSIYGRDLADLTIKYGVEVLDLVNTYGGQMIDLIRKTDGKVIPYAQKYGKIMFSVLDQPGGEDILSLCPVFGEEILQYAVQYPDDFVRYLLKYGNLAVKALREHGNPIVVMARRYGDEVIFYTGLYGDEAIRLANQGRPGIILLKVISEDREGKYNKQLLQSSLPRAYLYLLTRHPGKFNTYIGLLGETTLSVNPQYIQLIFWAIPVLILLYAIRIISKIFRWRTSPY
jgi:hypothetical protein